MLWKRKCRQRNWRLSRCWKIDSSRYTPSYVVIATHISFPWQHIYLHIHTYICTLTFHSSNVMWRNSLGNKCRISLWSHKIYIHCSLLQTTGKYIATVAPPAREKQCKLMVMLILGHKNRTSPIYFWLRGVDPILRVLLLCKRNLYLI